MSGKLKKSALFAALLLTSNLSHAYAEEGPIYLSGYLGLHSVDDEKFSNNGISGENRLSNGASFSGALGLRLTSQLSLEAELSYAKNDISLISTNGSSVDVGGEISRLMMMLSGRYEFDIPWRTKPFVTAGLGLGFYDGEITDTTNTITSQSGDDIGLTWSLGTGLKYKLNERSSVTGSYRYVGSSELSFGGHETEFGAHEIRLGLDYELY